MGLTKAARRQLAGVADVHRRGPAAARRVGFDPRRRHVSPATTTPPAFRCPSPSCRPSRCPYPGRRPSPRSRRVSVPRLGWAEPGWAAARTRQALAVSRFRPDRSVLPTGPSARTARWPTGPPRRPPRPPRRRRGRGAPAAPAAPAQERHAAADRPPAPPRRRAMPSRTGPATRTAAPGPTTRNSPSPRPTASPSPEPEPERARRLLVRQAWCRPPFRGSGTSAFDSRAPGCLRRSRASLPERAVRARPGRRSRTGRRGRRDGDAGTGAGAGRSPGGHSHAGNYAPQSRQSRQLRTRRRVPRPLPRGQRSPRRREARHGSRACCCRVYAGSRGPCGCRPARAVRPSGGGGCCCRASRAVSLRGPGPRARRCQEDRQGAPLLSPVLGRDHAGQSRQRD